jgi:hypothetical protein
MSYRSNDSVRTEGALAVMMVVMMIFVIMVMVGMAGVMRLGGDRRERNRGGQRQRGDDSI